MAATLIPTGVEGLDSVLGGGLAPNRLYLIEGAPGTGKTTLALQFLREGARRGESVLHLTLSETRDELRDAVESHGWTLEGLHIHELIPAEDALNPDEQYTMFHPSEVELSETTRSILDVVDRVKPSRVVFDSLSELRLLAGSSLRYRRQILAFKRYFTRRDCTVVMLDDLVGIEHDVHVESIAHAVLRLEQLHPDYGAERRRLSVLKYRGVSFRGGFHDYVITHGGLRVFPRLVASEHRGVSRIERCPSGVQALDDLLGGGIERGTSTLVVGAAGTGKSSLAAQFVVAGASRGQRAAMFIFDESVNTLLTRASGVGIDLQTHVESGAVVIQQVDPAELAPGEFAHAIRQSVDQGGASIVVIDSLNGFLNAMPEERFLIIQLHELLSYLGHAGVATILVGAHQGLIGAQMSSPVDASYLADAIILMRYFEYRGEVHQAISVVKKRGGAHERTIRQFHLGADGVTVGRPLKQFRGVLTGVPLYDGEDDGLKP